MPSPSLSSAELDRKRYLHDQGETRQFQVLLSCLCFLEATCTLHAFILLPAQVLRNIYYPASSPLFFSLPCTISLPIPFTYQLSQTCLSQCFPFHARFNAGLPRYLHVGAVVKVGRHTMHRYILKDQKSCSKRPFESVFIPVLKLIDPGTLYIIS